jgi:GNAT superfamily N-acetyltransferase
MVRPRSAVTADATSLLQLWSLLFDEGDRLLASGWRTHAQAWFSSRVEDHALVWFPVIEVDGDVIATAIGTLEVGVPNPYCVRGRTVRLANVITAPEHRGRGYGTLLVRDVIEWARSIDADRVDLSSTADGRRVYEKLGFVPTTAPRMKLVL